MAPGFLVFYGAVIFLIPGAMDLAGFLPNESQNAESGNGALLVLQFGIFSVDRAFGLTAQFFPACKIQQQKGCI